MIYEKFQKEAKSLTYPLRPQRPVLDVKTATPDQLRQYADAVEKCNAAMTEFEALRNEYNSKIHDIEQRFRTALAEEYGVAGHQKEPVLFRLAWDREHSGGYGDVENAYSDLSELLT